MDHEFPPRFAGLLHAAAYPHAVASVQLVQTHISWVLLTGEFAYKIKRPVNLPFADFRRPERRANLCSEEVRLNRRFAPELYLGVSAITESAGVVRMDGQGQIVEYAVRMRQFQPEEELDRLLASGIPSDLLRRFGTALASIHGTLPVAEPPQAWGDPARIREVVLANLDECRQAGSVLDAGSGLNEFRPWLETRLASSQALMAARKSVGCVRECHGDLHVRNIVRSGSWLVPFDCLEFEPAFRWIDVADEIAFLFVDLMAEGYPEHAHAFLDQYLSASGDYQACRLIGLYSVHRALVRAKVVALGIADASTGKARACMKERYLRYFASARKSLVRTRPSLLLMTGLPGSGKTWLARQLARKIPAIHIRSDVERKRLGGLAELGWSGSGVGEGLYSEQQNTSLYQHLTECASHVLNGGFSVIVDATFLRRADRARLQSLAVEVGLQPLLIQCQAPPEVLRARLEKRQRGGADASEADVDVLAWQEVHAEPPAADESFVAFAADTTRPEVVADVLAQVNATRST